jgi:hypothetical protein
LSALADSNVINHTSSSNLKKYDLSETPRGELTPIGVSVLVFTRLLRALLPSSVVSNPSKALL